MKFPDLPARPQPLHFRSTTYQSRKEGPALIVLAAVHGNEVCGTQAILKLIADFEAGLLGLQRGKLTLVPITNPLAYNKEQRNGDRNLNRNFAPTQQPLDFEDEIANWLSPLLAEHDVLLDLHSFQRGDRAFALFGPENNSSGLESFKHARAERSLALRLGVDRFVDGWLQTYADGVKARVKRLKDEPNNQSANNLTTDARYGVGTTESMRGHGGYAVTLECGQHNDPQAPVVAYKAILRTLAHLGMIDSAPADPVKHYEYLSLFKVIDKFHDEDTFSKNWLSFDSVKAGELIGIRHNGEEVYAEEEGYIVFPNTASKAGHEWFYLARANPENLQA